MLNIITHSADHQLELRLRSNEVKRHIERCHRKEEIEMERCRKYMALKPAPNVEMAEVRATTVVRLQNEAIGWQKLLTELTRQIKNAKMNVSSGSSSQAVDDALINANLLNALAMQATAPIPEERSKTFVNTLLKKILLEVTSEPPPALDDTLTNRLRNLRNP